MPLPPTRRPERLRFRRPALSRTSRHQAWWKGLFGGALWWRGPLIAFILVGVWWFASQSTLQSIGANEGWVKVSTRFTVCGVGPREEGCVVDGDTVLIGAGVNRRRIRLTGFDAPELDGACAVESALARTARTRLNQWLGEGTFEWDGGEDPPRDQYGRELRSARRVAADGSKETLAEHMIASDLAANNGWGKPPKDWCA